MRTRVMNQLHVVALNEGLRRKKALWRPAGRAELECSAGPVGEPTPARLARPARPAHAEDPGTEQAGTDRGETARDATTETHPGVGPLTALAFELVIGNAGTFSCAQADRQLRGAGAGGRVQRRSATAGPHQQTGQRSVALSAGGSGAGHGAQRSAMAQPVLSPGHAARTEDRQSRDGAKLAVELYWMWRRAGTTTKCKSSVRTRESPEIAMVCSKSPP